MGGRCGLGVTVARQLLGAVLRLQERHDLVAIGLGIIGGLGQAFRPKGAAVTGGHLVDPGAVLAFLAPIEQRNPVPKRRPA